MKTTINEKEIRLYGRKELSAEFTNVVTGYLQNGFVINYSRAARGSQGEEMKIDLTNDNGKTVYRVWMDTDRESLDKSEKWYRSVGYIRITVERYDDVEDVDTLWFGRGERVYEKRYYEIDERPRKVYCETKEEYLEISAKQDARWQAQRGSDIDYYCNTKELDEKYKKLALKSVKKIKGYKSTLLLDVTRVDRKFNGGYIVHLKEGKTCYLSLKK